MSNINIYKWLGFFFLLPLFILFGVMVFGTESVSVGASFGLFIALPFCLIPSLFFFIFYFNERSKLRSQENSQINQVAQTTGETNPVDVGTPHSIKALAFLMIISGIFSVLDAFQTLSVSRTTSNDFKGSIVSAYFFLISLISITSGFGLLRLKKWSYWLVIVSIVYGLLVSGWQSITSSSLIVYFAFKSIIPLAVLFFIYMKKDLFVR